MKTTAQRLTEYVEAYEADMEKQGRPLALVILPGDTPKILKEQYEERTGKKISLAEFALLLPTLSYFWIFPVEGQRVMEEMLKNVKMSFDPKEVN